MSNEPAQRPAQQQEITRLIQAVQDEPAAVADLRRVTRRLEDADRARSALAAFPVEQVQAVLLASRETLR